MGNRPHPHLRLVGGTCPPTERATVEREMERRPAAMGAELSVFVGSAETELDDFDLGMELLGAFERVQKARLALARRNAT